MKKTSVQSNINLETLAGGAFAEKLNEALMQVAENIQNPNTEATTKRQIQITLKFAPNKTRQLVSTQIAVTTLVQPDRSLANTLDGAKHVVTFLFPHGIAQQAAEQACVVTKREIFVFGGHGQRAQEGWSENYLLKASADERSSRGRISIRGKWPFAQERPLTGRYSDETRLRPAALAL